LDYETAEVTGQLTSVCDPISLCSHLDK